MRSPGANAGHRPRPWTRRSRWRRHRAPPSGRPTATRRASHRAGPPAPSQRPRSRRPKFRVARRYDPRGQVNVGPRSQWPVGKVAASHENADPAPAVGEAEEQALTFDSATRPVKPSHRPRHLSLPPSREPAPSVGTDLLPPGVWSDKPEHSTWDAALRETFASDLFLS